MSQRVTVELIDDLDSTTISEGEGRTVSFAFDGKSYQIDLSNENIAALGDVLAPYIAAARTAETASRKAGRAKRAGSSADLTAVREWARNNGYQVGNFGRLPREIIDAYTAANGK